MTHTPHGEAARHWSFAALPPGHLAEGGLPLEGPFGHALRLDRSLHERARPDRRAADRASQADRSEILVGVDDLPGAVDAEAPLHAERVELAAKLRDRAARAVGEHRATQAAGTKPLARARRIIARAICPFGR